MLPVALGMSTARSDKNSTTNIFSVSVNPSILFSFFCLSWFTSQNRYACTSKISILSSWVEILLHLKVFLIRSATKVTLLKTDSHP